MAERNSITVYVFDMKTGEHIGQSQAQPDPMDNNNWLIPAGATTDKPPQAGEDEVTVRVGGKYGAWEVKIDKRGTEYWLPDRTKHVITDIGEELPSDALLEEPPIPLEEQFQSEMDALNAQYDRDMIAASNAYNIAVARDGSTETEKVADARAWIADLDAQYDADQLAIINKYYGT